MFTSEEHAQRSRLFRQIAGGMMAVATTVLVVLMFVQPEQFTRALAALAAVNALGLVLLAVNRRGHTRAASIALVAGLVALVTAMSFSAGGIRSPGVTMFFIFVLMAGLLLGQRAGIVAAASCAAIGLALALFSSSAAVAHPAVPYSPIALWLLNTLYMGVVLILLRLATGAMAKALGRAESEIRVRQRAELEREHLVHDLGERVKELRLLHAVARVLQETRPFDKSVLEELVAMMPPAWQHPDSCEARIAYRETAVATPGWCESTRRLSAPFTTSAGQGVVEVIYRDEPRTTTGAFLQEERLLIDSIAEMLAAYLEHDIAERQRSQLETRLRQSQQMEALGTLAGGIAHDFNNLLTAIGSNTDLALTEASLTPAVKEHLTELRKAHARATDLVKRILLFSRRQESDRKPIALAPVVEEAVNLLRASFPATIDIQFSAEPDLPAVLADASQIHQVIMNLGTNAAHAMGERGGVLRISSIASHHRPRRRLAHHSAQRDGRSPRRSARPHQCQRYRHGHESGDSRTPVRTVLHHQGHGRHRPRIVRRSRHRGRSRWRHHGGQHDRPGIDVSRVPSRRGGRCCACPCRRGRSWTRRAHHVRGRRGGAGVRDDAPAETPRLSLHRLFGRR